MIFLALPDSFVLIPSVFLQEGQRVSINLHDIAVTYSYPYLIHGKAEVGRRLHGIDQHWRSTNSRTSALHFLPMFPFSCTSSETTNSEPGCSSEPPAGYFQSIHTILEGKIWGGFRESEDPPRGSKCLAPSPELTTTAVSVVPEYMHFGPLGLTCTH